MVVLADSPWLRGLGGDGDVAMEVDIERLLKELKPVFRGEVYNWRVSVILARPNVKTVVSRIVEDEDLSEVIQRIHRYCEAEPAGTYVSVVEVIYTARVSYETEPIVAAIQDLKAQSSNVESTQSDVVSEARTIRASGRREGDGHGTS